jgi:hypothetical protein
MSSRSYSAWLQTSLAEPTRAMTKAYMGQGARTAMPNRLSDDWLEDDGRKVAPYSAGCTFPTAAAGCALSTAGGLGTLPLATLPLVPDHMVLLCSILVDGAFPHGFECTLIADRAHVDGT